MPEEVNKQQQITNNPVLGYLSSTSTPVGVGLAQPFYFPLQKDNYSNFLTDQVQTTFKTVDPATNETKVSDLKLATWELNKLNFKDPSTGKDINPNDLYVNIGGQDFSIGKDLRDQQSFLNNYANAQKEINSGDKAKGEAFLNNPIVKSLYQQATDTNSLNSKLGANTKEFLYKQNDVLKDTKVDKTLNDTGIIDQSAIKFTDSQGNETLFKPSAQLTIGDYKELSSIADHYTQQGENPNIGVSVNYASQAENLSLENKGYQFAKSDANGNTIYDKQLGSFLLGSSNSNRPDLGKFDNPDFVLKNILPDQYAKFDQLFTVNSDSGNIYRKPEDSSQWEKTWSGIANNWDNINYDKKGELSATGQVLKAVGETLSTIGQIPSRVGTGIAYAGAAYLQNLDEAQAGKQLYKSGSAKELQNKAVQALDPTKPLEKTTTEQAFKDTAFKIGDINISNKDVLSTVDILGQIGVAGKIGKAVEGIGAVASEGAGILSNIFSKGNVATTLTFALLNPPPADATISDAAKHNAVNLIFPSLGNVVERSTIGLIEKYAVSKFFAPSAKYLDELVGGGQTNFYTKLASGSADVFKNSISDLNVMDTFYGKNPSAVRQATINGLNGIYQVAKQYTSNSIATGGINSIMLGFSSTAQGKFNFNDVTKEFTNGFGGEQGLQNAAFGLLAATGALTFQPKERRKLLLDTISKSSQNSIEFNVQDKSSFLKFVEKEIPDMANFVGFKTKSDKITGFNDYETKIDNVEYTKTAKQQMVGQLDNALSVWTEGLKMGADGTIKISSVVPSKDMVGVSGDALTRLIGDPSGFARAFLIEFTPTRADIMTGQNKSASESINPVSNSSTQNNLPEKQSTIVALIPNPDGSFNFKSENQILGRSLLQHSLEFAREIQPLNKVLEGKVFDEPSFNSPNAEFGYIIAKDNVQNGINQSTYVYKNENDWRNIDNQKVASANVPLSGKLSKDDFIRKTMGSAFEAIANSNLELSTGLKQLYNTDPSTFFYSLTKLIKDSENQAYNLNINTDFTIKSKAIDLAISKSLPNIESKDLYRVGERVSQKLQELKIDSTKANTQEAMLAYLLPLDEVGNKGTQAIVDIQEENFTRQPYGSYIVGFNPDKVLEALQIYHTYNPIISARIDKEVKTLKAEEEQKQRELDITNKINTQLENEFAKVKFTEINRLGEVLTLDQFKQGLAKEIKAYTNSPVEVKKLQDEILKTKKAPATEIIDKIANVDELQGGEVYDLLIGDKGAFTGVPEVADKIDKKLKEAYKKTLEFGADKYEGAEEFLRGIKFAIEDAGRKGLDLDSSSYIKFGDSFVAKRNKITPNMSNRQIQNFKKSDNQGTPFEELLSDDNLVGTRWYNKDDITYSDLIDFIEKQDFTKPVLGDPYLAGALAIASRIENIDFVKQSTLNGARVLEGIKEVKNDLLNKLKPSDENDIQTTLETINNINYDIQTIQQSSSTNEQNATQQPNNGTTHISPTAETKQPAGTDNSQSRRNLNNNNKEITTNYDQRGTTSETTATQTNNREGDTGARPTAIPSINTDEFKPFQEKQADRYGTKNVIEGTKPNWVNSGTIRERLGLEPKANQNAVNTAITAFIKDKDSRNETYSDSDKEVISSFTGAGGLAKQGATGAGLLSQYFTNEKIVTKMWGLAKKYGFTGGDILEPAVGTGNVLRYAENASSIDAYEIDKTPKRITEILYPNAKVNLDTFENLFIKSNQSIKNYEGKKYDLVIGNPPYGDYKSRASGMGESLNGKIKKFEHYFILRGIDTLKEGGLLVYIIPSSFLRNENTYNFAKAKIAENAQLLDAYRLPENTFDTTSIGTDILVFKKVTNNPDGTLPSDKWFIDHPEKILGTKTTKTNQYGDMVDVIVADSNNTIDNVIVPEVNTVQSEIPLFVSQNNTELEDTQLLPVEEKILEKRAASKQDTIYKENIVETKDTKLLSLEEADKLFNQGDDLTNGITDKEKEVWYGSSYDRDGDIVYANKNTEILTKEGYLSIYKDKFIPSIIYYSGNIYDKLDQLEIDYANKSIDDNTYKLQKGRLNDILPKKLSVDSENAKTRLVLLPGSDFARELVVTKGLDGKTLEEDKQFSLTETFSDWVRDLSQEEVGPISRYDIINIYLRGDSPRTGDPERNKQLKQQAKESGDRLFGIFLKEGINSEIKDQINELWNRQLNSKVSMDYSRIPFKIQVSKTFKGKPLKPRDVQREALGFIQIKGSGILALDTGLGKTMTAILASEQMLENSRAKKPLFIVPKQVYKKWVSEITQILPHRKLNQLENLNEKITSNLKINDESISIMTYEGFLKLSFNGEAESNARSALAQVMYQGQEGRKGEKFMEKVSSLTGKGLKYGELDIDIAGFDAVIYDEAHAMKKGFTDVKSSKDNKNSYSIRSGTPSIRALKGYMVSQYIADKNNGKNVILLTATPFTNSPLEIYTMLALVGSKKLEQMNIKNLQQFFDTFVKTETALVPDAQLNFSRKAIVRAFNNLQPLQALIKDFIIYKTSAQTGIKLPNKEVSTPALRPTILQSEQLDKIQAFTFAENDDILNMQIEGDGDIEEGSAGKGDALSKDDTEAGKLLKAISMARLSALSPYLVPSLLPAQDKNPSYKQFVENSPKIKFVMDSIKSIRDYHIANSQEVSGQVIYLNTAVSRFSNLKEYLVKEVGYKDSEVGIITGNVASDKREVIKEDFLAGKIKIVIGSKTILEGVDLQNKSTTLYNLFLDWNPTDIKQLEGRIHRFGNEYSNVRVVTPVIEDSIDIFLLQKLAEKTARINDIWSAEGNTFNLEQFNPDELKEGLVRDPNKLASLKIDLEKNKVYNEISIQDKLLKSQQKVLLILKLKL